MDRIPVILVDVDGTLANGSHRQHLVQSKPKNWPAYQKLGHKDTPHLDIVSLVRTLHEKWDIFIVSGRNEDERVMTEEWLVKHDIPYRKLFMRPSKDYRSDDIIKREILDQIRAIGYEPLFVLDDRNRVVKMWRENGIRCLQVAEGDF